MIIIFIRAVHKHSSFLSKHLVVLHFLIQFEFRCGQVTSCSQWWLITWSIYKLEPPSFWVREHLQGTNLHACAQSWLTLCNPMDCSPPGSTVHEIFQARILECAAISFSRGSSQPRDGTHIFCIGRQVLYRWATLEAWGTDYRGGKSKRRIHEFVIIFLVEHDVVWITVVLAM